MLEGGLGFYHPIGDIATFEAFAGAGGGKVSFNRSYQETLGNSTTFDRYSAKTFRYFFQPNIGIKTDFADFALSMRISNLKFSNIDTSGYTGSNLIEYDISDLDKHNYTFFEPALTVRFGYKYVKFHMQFIYIILTSPYPLNHYPYNFNVGLTFNFASRYK